MRLKFTKGAFATKEDVNFVNEPLIIKKGGHSDQLSGANWGMDRFRIYSIEKILNDFLINKDFLLLRLKVIFVLKSTFNLKRS